MKRVGFDWVARGSCRHPEFMTLKGGSLCSVDFPAMVGIIRHPQEGVILFDTGYDPAFLRATEPFPERFYRWATPVRLPEPEGAEPWLASLGISISDVRAVIISHFHGDHVAALGSFGGARIYCSSHGLGRVRSGSRLGRVSQGLLSSLVPEDVGERARFFEEMPPVELESAFRPLIHGRDILGDGSLLAVELPGHCPGHWGLALRTESGRHVLLAADAAWSRKAIARDVPPPRITTNLLGNTQAYRQTLATLHAAGRANPDLALLPSHCADAAQRYADAG